jgi:cyclopropane fatty-acyl-phospholipid synthase-like methyltransferase
MYSGKYYKTWKEVWENRKTQVAGNLSELQKLILLNGFDTPPNIYSENEWYELVDQIIDISELTSNSKVLEIGCGSGALLYGLKSRINCSIYGVEKSKSLYSIAKKNLDAANIYLLQASKINSLKGQHDLILMHSVVQYFPNHNYFLKVIQSLDKLLYPGGKILIMDIPDKQYIDSKNLLNSVIHPGVKLKHLYFDKDSLFRDLKKNNYSKIMEFGHVNKRYGNSKYRFNLKIER